MMKKILIYLTLFLLIPSLGAMEFDEALKELQSPDFKKRSEARFSIRDTLSVASRPGADSSESKELESKLIEFIRSEPAPDAVRWGLQILGHFGGEKSTPLFVELAGSDDRSIQMQSIQSLAWSSDPGATSALSELLSNASTPELKIAFIRALGQRQQSSETQDSSGILSFLRPKSKSADTPAVRQIASFLSDDDEVVEAAARALAHIGSPSSVEPLSKARDNHKGTLRIAIESALLASDPESSILTDLSLNGTTAAIRTAAFQKRVQKDPGGAKEALDKEIALISSGKSSGELLDTAMNSPLQKEIMESLTQLPAHAQIVALGSIADLKLKQYEETVLELTVSDHEPVRNQAMETLGFIGTVQSYERLFDESTKGNQAAFEALARIGDSKIDSKLMQLAKGGTGEEPEVVALKLIGERNPEGGKALIHSLLKKKPIDTYYAIIEKIGDIESATLLAEMIVEGKGETRRAQGSLKKLAGLSKSPELYWKEVFLPHLNGSQPAETRANLMAIMDVVAIDASLEFLKQKVQDPNDPLRDAAFKSLLRWKSYQASNVWIAALKAEKPQGDTLTTIENGLIRLLKNQGGRARPNARNQTAVDVIPLLPTAESKLKILNVIATPDNKDKKNLKEILPALLDDKDVGKQVQQFLDSLSGST